MLSSITGLARRIVPWVIVVSSLWHATTVCAQVHIFRSGDELVVQLDRLDVLRQRHRGLVGTLQIEQRGMNRQFTIDYDAQVVPQSVIVDLTGEGECLAASLRVVDGAGNVVATSRVQPIPQVKVRDPQGKAVKSKTATSDQGWSAIERGSQMPADDSPQIELPTHASVREVRLQGPTRTVRYGNTKYPVVADANPPGIGSTNYVIWGKASGENAGANSKSFYLSYRQPLFDSKTWRLKYWRKMLVEVPLDPEWLKGQGDREIDLPLDKFTLHVTDEREKDGRRWNSTNGYHMLGDSQSGLFQGGQTADVDDQGRIYITNVPDGAGIVRFNPRTRKFEQPPVNCFEEFKQFVPPLPGWRRNWDTDLAQAVCRAGRVFLVFDRNYRVHTPNGDFETCSGVISIPQEFWDDAEAFRREIRLNAACWPIAEFPLYRDEPAVGGLPRRLGAPLATTHGIVFSSYRLDVDDQGRTTRLSEVRSPTDAVDGAGRPLPETKVESIEGMRRQRWLNVGAAGRAMVQQAYGELKFTRGALMMLIPGLTQEPRADKEGRALTTFPGAPAGELTLRFDLVGKIASEPERYGELAHGLSGPSPGPTYAALAVPSESGRMVAVCEYTYFLSELDFSRRQQEKVVRKSFLKSTASSGAGGFPLAARLGPYNAAWVDHDKASWLYLVGYTGMSRLKYAEAGEPTTKREVEVFHTRLAPKGLDGASRDSIKDYVHLFPTTDRRWIDIGRGRVGRGGGARSAGLELFDPIKLGASQTAVEMTRCYGLHTPVGRIVYSAAGDRGTHEIFVASGEIRPEYVENIEDESRRPENRDPKVFQFACSAGGPLRDLFGFALPADGEGRVAAANLAISSCRRFLIIMQDNGRLLSYHLRERRFVDAVELTGATGQPIVPLEFTRPSAWLWTSPDDRVFFHAAREESGAPASVDFFEVRVARDGQLELAPHLAVLLDNEGKPREFEKVVRCFMPDLERFDGSYDLVLGGEQAENASSFVRVLDDFVPPRR